LFSLVNIPATIHSIDFISLPYNYSEVTILFSINPLNAELIPICHLLALLAAHHILYISRIRVNSAIEWRTFAFVSVAGGIMLCDCDFLAAVLVTRQVS